MVVVTNDTNINWISPYLENNLFVLFHCLSEVIYLSVLLPQHWLEVPDSRIGWRRCLVHYSWRVCTWAIWMLASSTWRRASTRATTRVVSSRVSWSWGRIMTRWVWRCMTTVCSSWGWYVTLKAVQIVATHTSWHYRDVRWRCCRCIVDCSTRRRLLLIEVISGSDTISSSSSWWTRSTSPRNTLKLWCTWARTISRHVRGSTFWIDTDNRCRRWKDGRWLANSTFA